MKRFRLKYNYHEAKQGMPKRFRSVKYRCQNCLVIFKVFEASVSKCPFCEQVKDFSSLFRIEGNKILVKHAPHEEIHSLVRTNPKLMGWAKSIPPEMKTKITRVIPHDRRKEIMVERKEVAIFLRKDLGFSWSKIGRIIKRDHSTIINLVRPKKLSNK